MLSALTRQLRPGWAGRLCSVATSSRILPRTVMTENYTETYVHDEKMAQDDLFPKPQRWPRHNEKIHPPEKPVDRYYCHYRANIKYSPKKMFFIASFIRGMSIDEAIKQLTYIERKGAQILIEVLEEAREIALAEHNFEYRSKMWIADSFASKGLVIKGMRKHARRRFGEMHYMHLHYFVKLVEGDPPADYKPGQGPYLEDMTVDERLNDYIDNKLRKRRIDFAL